MKTKELYAGVAARTDTAGTKINAANDWLEDCDKSIILIEKGKW